MSRALREEARRRYPLQPPSEGRFNLYGNDEAVRIFVDGGRWALAPLRDARREYREATALRDALIEQGRAGSEEYVETLVRIRVAYDRLWALVLDLFEED